MNEIKILLKDEELNIKNPLELTVSNGFLNVKEKKGRCIIQTCINTNEILAFITMTQE